MAKTPQHYDASNWTGDIDPVEAKVLGIALALGAIGFLIIGLAILG